MTEQRTHTITEAQAGARLDKALAEAMPDLSRARIQALLREGCVFRGENKVDDASLKVKGRETFEIRIPDLAPAHPKAEEIPLSIVYEDDDLLVIDKPAGLVVHPGAGNWEGTLVNALLAHCGASLSGIGGVARPGIVHRLDKDTSGLLVAAKNDAAHKGLTAQFADREISRTYQALVWGVPDEMEGRIEGAIGRHPRARQKMAVVARGGKEALTFYRVIEVFGGIASLVECKLATGRTHQIRVHMAHKGHPLIGDPLYGARSATAKAKKTRLVSALEDFKRQALHAGELRFTHPLTGKHLKFKAPMPADLKALLKRLRAAF